MANKDGNYFSEFRKGEVNELMQMLRQAMSERQPEAQKEAIQKVIGKQQSSDVFCPCLQVYCLGLFLHMIPNYRKRIAYTCLQWRELGLFLELIANALCFLSLYDTWY